MTLPIRHPGYPDVMTAVYRLYDARDRLLYVGIAYDFDVRFRQHAETKAWWPEVARKDVTWFTSRLDAAYEESRAIDEECPVYNDQPGIDPLGLILFRVRSWNHWEPWAEGTCPANPTLAVADHAHRKVAKAVAIHGAYAAAVVDGKIRAYLVPAEWYERAAEALGEPVPHH